MSELNNPPARQIQKRGLKKKVNWVGGDKMRMVAQTESGLESNILASAQLDPRVVAIETQPVTFDLNTGREYGRRADLARGNRQGGYEPWVYTPDFRLTLTDCRTVFVEGKHTYWLEQNPKWHAVPDAVRSFGIRLIVVTDKHLPEPVVRNTRVLLASRRDVDFACLTRVLEKFDHPVKCRRLTDDCGIQKGTILAGIACGVIGADLEKRLGPNSNVWFANGDTSHLQLLDL